MSSASPESRPHDGHCRKQGETLISNLLWVLIQYSCVLGSSYVQQCPCNNEALFYELIVQTLSWLVNIFLTPGGSTRNRNDQGRLSLNDATCSGSGDPGVWRDGGVSGYTSRAHLRRDANVATGWRTRRSAHASSIANGSSKPKPSKAVMIYNTSCYILFHVMIY